LQLRVESGQTEKADSVKITIGQGPGSDYHDPPEVEAGDYDAITLGDILELNDAWVAGLRVGKVFLARAPRPGGPG
jgi:hypothetical protein